MINYYEVLEVSEKASDEVIEKAYKVLAKKYHPDLQQNENKKAAEEKMKLVNEAYEVLSNNAKREAYNKKLYEQRERENIKKQVQANINNSYTIQNYSHSTTAAKNNSKQQKNDKEEIKKQQKIKSNVQKEARRRYLEAYDNYLRSLGYKSKYRWTWKKIRDLLITILILIFVGAIVWIIPPSREYMIKLYEENFVIKMIVDIIISLIKSFIDIFKK